MPLTALTMLISTLATFFSWLFISERLRSNPSGNTHQARLLSVSLLYSTFYGLCMLLPFFVLIFNREAFPPVMATGFVVGHIFLYLSFLQMLRLTFSIIPPLSDKEDIAVTVGLIAIMALSIYTARTMLWGTQPEFNSFTGITDFHAAPLVDLGNVLFGVVGAVPAALLMIVNGITNAYMRTRSFLIGGGVIILIISGPMVEGAHQLVAVAIANTISVLGLLTLTIGIAYRIDQKLSLARQPDKRN